MSDEPAKQQAAPSVMEALGAAIKTKTGVLSIILTLLVSAVASLWNGGERFVAWTSKHAERVIDTHVKSVENTDAAVKQLTETNGKIEVTQREIADTQRQQGKAIDGIHETLQGVQRTQESIDATLKRLPAKE